MSNIEQKIIKEAKETQVEKITHIFSKKYGFFDEKK